MIGVQLQKIAVCQKVTHEHVKHIMYFQSQQEFYFSSLKKIQIQFDWKAFLRLKKS